MSLASSRDAFTLTEILVALGIVLLLAAVTFPIISRVKEVGRQTTCSANLRQIGIALQAYVQDTQGLYPPAHIYGDNCVWAHRLLHYAKTPTLFECPSYPQGSFAPACSLPDHDSDPTRWFNGGYNWNQTLPPGTYALRQNIIRQPADMVLVCDGLATDEAIMTPVTVPAETVADLGNNSLAPRHGYGVNALYADGHVKWLSMQKLLDKSIWQYR